MVRRVGEKNVLNGVPQTANARRPKSERVRRTMAARVDVNSPCKLALCGLTSRTIQPERPRAQRINT